MITTFVPASSGLYMALGHRPKFKTLPVMKLAGVQHVVTLLADREGGGEVASAVRYEGMNALHLPMDNANPENITAEWLRRAVNQITDLQGFVFMHCSAGIHRTGMMGYAVLRTTGHDPGQAREKLRQMRDATREGVTEERLEAIEELL